VRVPATLRIISNGNQDSMRKFVFDVVLLADQCPSFNQDAGLGSPESVYAVSIYRCCRSSPSRFGQSRFGAKRSWDLASSSAIEKCPPMRERVYSAHPQCGGGLRSIFPICSSRTPRTVPRIWRHRLKNSLNWNFRGLSASSTITVLLVTPASSRSFVRAAEFDHRTAIPTLSSRSTHLPSHCLRSKFVELRLVTANSDAQRGLTPRRRTQLLY